MDGVKVKETQLGGVHRLLKKVFEMLGHAVNSRENSLVKTKLEEAIMWNNKDRAIKGELEKSKTFVG